MRTLEGVTEGERMLWNEEQQMVADSNAQGVHHYVYDYKGERMMKSSFVVTQTWQDDDLLSSTATLEAYTVYRSEAETPLGALAPSRDYYSPCSRRDREPKATLARPNPDHEVCREGESLYEWQSGTGTFTSPYRFNDAGTRSIASSERCARSSIRRQGCIIMGRGITRTGWVFG